MGALEVLRESMKQEQRNTQDREARAILRDAKLTAALDLAMIRFDTLHHSPHFSDRDRERFKQWADEINRVLNPEQRHAG
jgi:hypothetical protein